MNGVLRHAFNPKTAFASFKVADKTRIAVLLSGQQSRLALIRPIAN